MADGSRWLVVGLGNPPGEYGGTRHNIGADAVRALADRLDVKLKVHKAQAHVADAFTRPGGTPVTLAVCHGYMNKSGGPTQALAAFYKVEPDRIVVAHDDLDLELGQIRLKHGGGTAGHKGLKDIAQRLGTPDFLRVRIGIGRPPGRQPARDYVLGRFKGDEAEDAQLARERAGDAVVDLVEDGLEAAQNRYHTR